MYLSAVCFVASIAVAFGKDLRIDLSELSEKAVGSPSEQSGLLLSKWTPDDGTNPEEIGEYEQGDILFTGVGENFLRNGLFAISSRWPGGIIPFVIDGDFDAYEMATIEEAIMDYHMQTCVRFVPRTMEPDFIVITDEFTGCWSSVGRVGGPQKLNLQRPACVKRKGTVIHELMHACGFLHEQNREDRDKNVDIEWKNIKKNHEHNFNKAAKKSTSDFGIPYNFGSIMHYSNKAFSANGKPTIVPKKETHEHMGQRIGFSINDIRKINRMYNCE